MVFNIKSNWLSDKIHKKENVNQFIQKWGNFQDKKTIKNQRNGYTD